MTTPEEDVENALAGRKKCRKCGQWVSSWLGKAQVPKRVICWPCWRKACSVSAKERKNTWGRYAAK